MGRKAKTKKQKIEELLSKGKTVKEVIKMTGSTPAYVYKVRMGLHSKIEYANTKRRMTIEPEMIDDIIARHAAKTPPKKTWWQRLKELVC